MHINEIYIENYGCIKKLVLKPELNKDGNPKPIVLVGKNGSGKTLLLSNIVDSLIEFKRVKYVELLEVNIGEYFRIGSKSYIHNGANHSFINIKYTEGDKTYSYSDLMVYDYDKFKSITNAPQYNNIDIENSRLKDVGFLKTTSANMADELEANIVSYFPVHRYYEPAWLNKNVSLQFTKEENYVGKSNRNIIKTNVLFDIESWILDILLDRYLYEIQLKGYSNLFFKHSTPDGSDEYHEAGYKVFLGYEGKNSKLITHINKILSTIYISNNEDIEAARIGVSKKDGGRKISIIIHYKNGSEVTIAPTFNHLSSGEAILLSIFCCLLKEYDSITNEAKNLEDIKGIVVIDEIDLNLHIDYAKNVLPKLMKLFPKIQFIVTTHSPFFLLGMKDIYKDEYQLVNMPTGEYISENDFSEMVSAYNVFTEGFEDLRKNLLELENIINNDTIPLIITEGKTDWKHIKKALEAYNVKGEFSDIDVVFLEYEDNIQMGDSQLNALLENLAKVPQSRKIIGIFDCDEANGRKYAKLPFEDFGNNVYAFSIVRPSFRNNHSGIPIEMLYTDSDVKTVDSNGRRLYLTSEFNERGRLLSDNNISVENTQKVKKYLNRNNNKILDSGVTDGEKNLALSKNDFALNILNSVPPFDKVCFKGFRDTLDRLNLILNK